MKIERIILEVGQNDESYVPLSKLLSLESHPLWDNSCTGEYKKCIPITSKQIDALEWAADILEDLEDMDGNPLREKADILRELQDNLHSFTRE